MLCFETPVLFLTISLGFPLAVGKNMTGWNNIYCIGHIHPRYEYRTIAMGFTRQV